MRAALLTACLCALVAAPAGGAMLVQRDGGAATAETGATGTGATEGSGPTFVVTGGGNGHGVGLNQYGALAQARAGRSAADILAFYFPGTQPAHRSSRKLRVLVVPTAKSLTISSQSPYAVEDGLGQTHQLDAGALSLGPELQIALGGVPTQLTGPLTFTPANGSVVSVGSRAYRGAIEVSSDGTSLQAVDVVGVEAYVEGVVPGEMPATWPAAALQAQAIAARSYALATLVKGKAWDLFADGRGQRYLGATAETPEITAAVRATAGTVLLFGRSVATTFYSSSSGGQTQSALDAFGLDVPYLPSQDDPWDATSPYHAWQPRAYTGRQLAKALGLSAPVVDATSRFSPSGRVVSLAVTAADGSSLGITGTQARKLLALRSTDFHLGTLRFLTSANAATAGEALRLTGVARDADHPTLQRLGPAGAWVPVVRRLQVDSTGTFATVVHPTQTTTYRLSASGLAGPVLTISVVGTQP